MNDTNILENQPIAWRPTQDVIERAQLTKFMKQTGAANWDELYKKSIEDVEGFTGEVLKFLDIKFDPPYEKLLDTSQGIEWSKWCVGGGLNITEMCLDHWIGTEIENQAAVIWEGEAGEVIEISYKELLEQVELCAAGLRAVDLRKGDAIGIHLPMIPETVIALLAINRIGAIAVPVFSGYGIEAIASRMNAVKAKALFACDGFSRRGKKIITLETAFEAALKCSSIDKVFVINSLHKEAFLKYGKKSSFFPNAVHSAYPNIELREISDVYKALLKIKTGGRDFENVTKLPFKERLEIYTSVSFSYLDVIRFMQEKGYEIDKTIIEKAIDKMMEQSSQTKPETSQGGSAFAGGRITKIAMKIPSKYKFEAVPWKELLRVGEEKISDYSLEKTDANDPLIILYSSGTTGRPKGIAHVHCGFPIKAAQDMAFGTDVGRGTRISWVTDIGWMMGPWLIYGALINGATMCLYDGSPDYPNADRMWEFSAKHKVEILGISPTLIRVLSTKGDDLPKKHDLSSLRAFASTGEPWNPAPWYWLFEKVGDGKLPIINYSGGTEISGGILMGNPLLPQKAGSFSAPCLGIDADILDEEGNSAAAGEVGELAIRKPWIGMARGFWEENERYLETYWSRFEKIWVHSDFAMKDADGHWYILGRSDDTLNVAGKRVGPAEIESLLVADERVAEAAVIGVPHSIKGTAMVAFCVLTENTETENLEAELKSVVAKDMGKPLTPSRIYFVSALPKTRNAKVMRRVIRSAYLGEDAGDLSALENPKSVKEIQIFRIE